MYGVFERVAMIVESNPACQLRMAKKDKIVLEVANSIYGIDIVSRLMESERIQGYLSLGRDNKTWFVTIPV